MRIRNPKNEWQWDQEKTKTKTEEKQISNNIPGNTGM
jgi:hypothetical protein